MAKFQKDRIGPLSARVYRIKKDYGHVEMIISKAANEEVWPRIAGWLDAHG